MKIVGVVVVVVVVVCFIQLGFRGFSQQQQPPPAGRKPGPEPIGGAAAAPRNSADLS